MTSNLKPRDAESVRVEKSSAPPFVNSNSSWAVLEDELLTRRFIARGASGSSARRPNISLKRLSISQVVA